MNSKKGREEEWKRWKRKNKGERKLGEIKRKERKIERKPKRN